MLDLFVRFLFFSFFFFVFTTTMIRNRKDIDEQQIDVVR